MNSLPRAPERILLEPQERFATLVAAGASYAAAYREAYNRPLSASSTVSGCRLAAQPRVRARILELRRLASEGAVFSIQARMARLDLIAHADPSELTRTEVVTCPLCWPDTALADAMDAWLADPESPMPDTTKPRHDCRGGPHAVTTITPTSELSEAGRALYKGARVSGSGHVEVMMHDQLQAIDLLNRMQAVYVDKSVSIRANVNVPNLETMSNDDVLDFLDSIKPAAS